MTSVQLALFMLFLVAASAELRHNVEDGSALLQMRQTNNLQILQTDKLSVCTYGGTECFGNQCCPGVLETQNRMYPCPAADEGWNECANSSFVGLSRASTSGRLSSRSKIFGVNYGNRFIPEEWMASTGAESFFWEGVVAQGKEPGSDHARLSLPDLGAERFAERMPKWLDMMIVESDFAKMAQLGVEVVRVPCGYWNWVSYEPGQGPTAPAKQAERMKVLTTLPPSTYKRYFDSIFEWAEKYGLQVLLDLHAVPGSSNGMQHGGICMEAPYWHLPGNVDKTLEAVQVMAQYCSRKGDILYGLEVINEPGNFDRAHYEHGIHGLLDYYYTRAILRARAHLAAQIPIIVFEWTYNMRKWPSNRFPSYFYGTVMWDTHIYTVWKPTHNLNDTMDVYWGDIEQLEEFNNRQAGGTLVGEWSLAGIEYDDTYTPVEKAEKLRELASWAVWCFMERSNGSLYWNLDAEYTEQSFERSGIMYGIDWVGMPKPT